MGRNHIHFAIGLPGKNGVISGMRSTCEVVIEINMVKALFKNNIPFFISSNKVILSPGISDGSLPTNNFRTVLDFKKK